MSRRLVRPLFLPLSLMLITTAALVVPMPVFLESPGDVLGLAERVTVDAPGAGEVDGDFLLTTVFLEPGTMVGLVGGWLDEEVRAIPSTSLLPPGVDSRQYFDRQRDLFRETSDVAAAVGLRAAGYDVDVEAFTGDGALVVEVVPGSPAAGLLRPGDVIVAAGRRDVHVAQDLRDRITAVGEGAPLELTVERDGEPSPVQVTPAAVPGVSDSPIIGIGLETLNPRTDLPVPVEVDSGRVGGPSAGLMIALTVYDKADPADLADGRRIAGTGTIGADGRVGPIGGITQKVLAAARQDVDVFLAPGAQMETARAAVPSSSDLEVIGVATFDDAVRALRSEVTALR
jgi:PDZ domain-containing protein